MAGLAACSESPWAPADSEPVPGGERPMAAVVSETKGFHADVPTLPDWKTVISSLTSPGCVLHFRRATGVYASKEYKLVYSDAAKEASKDWWWPLLYSVTAEVTRPAADGGTETLPERVGIRALCLLPKSDQGTEEGVGAVKAILEALGIFELDQGSADANALAPEGEAPSWVLAPLGWARSRLSPRPLSAAQGTEHRCKWKGGENCAVEEIGVKITSTPISISCPAGFDFDWVAVGCTHTGFSPTPIAPGDPFRPSGGSAPGNKGDGEDGETGRQPVEFTLSCPTVPRGAGGSCSVSASGQELRTLEFAWSSASGGVTVGTVSKTLGKMSWSGAAVSDVTVTVTISDPSGAIAGATETATAAVTRRIWALARNSHATPAHAALGAGGWGRFDALIPDFAASQGTGPWEGLRYVAGAAGFGTRLLLHPDLDPAKATSYGTRDDATGVEWATLQHDCPNSADLGDRETVPALNGTCGRTSEYEAWVEEVEAHEREHEGNYNVCADSRQLADDLAAIEGLLGDRVDELDQLELNFLLTLDRGIDAGVGGTNATSWDHRRVNKWYLGSFISGHSGAPCPA